MDIDITLLHALAIDLLIKHSSSVLLSRTMKVPGNYIDTCVIWNLVFRTVTLLILVSGTARLGIILDGNELELVSPSAFLINQILPFSRLQTTRSGISRIILSFTRSTG